MSESQNQQDYLKEFVRLADVWLGDRKAGTPQNETEDALTQKWGVVEEVFKQLGINYHGETDHHAGRGVKGTKGDLFIDGFAGSMNSIDQRMNLAKLRASALSALTKLETSTPLVANTLPSVNQVISILHQFPDVVSRFTYRRKGKTPVEITDEYDVQDFVYAMLKGPFPTLQYENPNTKVGINSSVADFTIDDLGLFIETKFISTKGRERSIQDECKQDMVSYTQQAGCTKIIFFIYDPEKCIDNEYAFRNGLGNKFTHDSKEVDIHTIILR